jgi:DNA-binding IclR family transcriptional regulator
MSDMSAEDGGDKYIVPALERGLRVLAEFGRDSQSLGAPELARRLDLPRSTVFRLLNTLESMGFLERTHSGNDYRLGMAVLRLGFEYLSSLELTELGQAVLTRLCDSIAQPCNLAVRDGRAIVYVSKVTPPTPFTSALRVGTRLPVHGTVFGRILLSDFTLPELRTLYPEDRLERYSDSTPGTVLALFNLIVDDRQRGYAMGQGYYDQSISPIVAPVRDDTGRVVAALGTTIANGSVDALQMEDMAQRVRAAADELSQLLNYRPNRTVVELPSQRMNAA